jgi:hypothetical protein
MVVPTIIALMREYREYKERKRAGPEKQVEHRRKIKEEIVERLRWPEHGASPEIIVRDIARLNDYPTLDDSLRAISPWFKVEALGFYHRGLEVVVSLREVVVNGKSARDAKPDERASASTMIVAGRIPFDAVVTIDWSGDEYYQQPHFYCSFDQKDGPYEAVVLHEKDSLGHWNRREDLSYRPERQSLRRAWQGRRQLRKAQRDWERQVEAEESS